MCDCGCSSGVYSLPPKCYVCYPKPPPEVICADQVLKDVNALYPGIGEQFINFYKESNQGKCPESAEDVKTFISGISGRLKLECP